MAARVSHDEWLQGMHDYSKNCPYLMQSISHPEAFPILLPPKSIVLYYWFERPSAFAGIFPNVFYYQGVHACGGDAGQGL